MVVVVLATGLRIPDLSWDVVTVNVGVLEEHVQTSLILGQRVAGNPAKGKKMFKACWK